VLESRDFLRLKRTGLSRRQIQFQRPVAHAPDLLYVMAYFFEHLSDLSIAAFMQRDLEPGILGLFDHAYLCRRRFHSALRIALLGNRDSGTQASKLIFRGLSRNFHQVRFGNVRSRLHQLVRQLTVIGEQQQPFTVEVEAPDGIKARLAAHQLHHRGASFGIGDRGHVSPGFVHHDVLVTLSAGKQLVVDADRVGLGIGFAAKLGDDRPVHHDQSSLNHFFGFAARGDAGGSDDLL
jgi:hypothetical protein